MESSSSRTFNSSFLSILLLLLLLSSSSSSALLTQFNATLSPDTGDFFGHAMATSGNLMVVGAYNGNGNASYDGAAYLYSCASFPCTQVDKLFASDGAENDQFAWSVAITGTRVVIGAPYDNTEPVFDHGSAYLFDCNSTSCTEVTKIVADNMTAFAQFGYSVAISGNLVASGANAEDSNQGAVYVFSCPSSSCTQITRLTVPAAMSFGTSVAIDGGTLVVGGPDTTSNQGRVYLFECNTTSCIPGATLAAPNPSPDDYFGASVAISGEMVVVGASGSGSSNGAAHVYWCSSASNCTLKDNLTAVDGVAGDYFGQSVAIFDSLVAVGAYHANLITGVVYLYDCLSFPCMLITKMADKTSTEFESLGISLAFMGWKVGGGAPGGGLGEMRGTVQWFDPTPLICNCSSAGSQGSSCGSDRQCSCIEGWTGLKCDNPPTPIAEDPTYRGAIVGGVVGGVLGIAAVLILVLLFVRFKKGLSPFSSKKSKFDMAVEGVRGGPSAVGLTSGSTDHATMLNTINEISLPGFLMINTETQLRIEQDIAAGGGGKISIATILDEKLKASNEGSEKAVVKVVAGVPSFDEDDNQVLFQQEVAAMSALRNHRYVATLLGFCNTPRTIVTPLYAGDLYDYIHGTEVFRNLPSNHSISFPFQATLTYQIVDAFSMMHAVGIVHRDLKTKNLLLEATPNSRFPYKIRVSDFGICRIVQEQGIKNQNFLNVFGVSVRYAAPEVFSRGFIPHANLDPEDEKKTDVYSFAICIWEMFTKQIPWGENSSDGIQEKVGKGERPALPPIKDELGEKEIQRALLDLIVFCWNQSPHLRPSFRDIHTRVHNLGFSSFLD